jgi:hypothetical protein
MIKMARIKKNGIEIPKKILNHKWDELVDRNCLINGQKAGRLLGFKADGRVIFKDRTQFIININDINSLSKHI